MTEKVLRAGLIGLGMMGRHHARVLQSISGVELVAVADPIGDPHGAAHGYELGKDVEHLIAAGIDYAVVAVPTIYHQEIALRLAEAGKHALIEKPLAATVAGAQEVADAFQKAGLIGAVGHIERYNPALQSLKSRLANGDLGDVYQVVTRRQGTFPARIADVGVVKDLSIHDLDLTAWVTGSHYQTVAAQTTRRSGREFEDLVAIVGQLHPDIVTSHLVNWLSPFKERVTVVTGERGAYVADTLTADLTFYENGTEITDWGAVAEFRGVSEGDVTRYAIAKKEPLKTEHETFRDALLGKSADIVTLQQGVAILKVVEAVLESAASGQTVQLG